MVNSKPKRELMFGHCVGIGLMLCSVGYGAYLAVQQLNLSKWPSAQATITEFQSGIVANSESHWYANPKVKFRYEVAGRRYEGTRLNPSPFNYQSADHLTRETFHLKSGTQVPCWYNPTSPDEAYVVNVGITAAPTILVVVGLVCLSIFGPQSYAAFKRWRSRKDD
jgi:hypothetical protein